MKIYQSNADYPGYSFPTVALAYFLRYPNPYAKHVISTDTISQHIDPITQRLHTVRLHLKKSKVPTAVVKFLPKAMTGADGSSKTYILEKSVVDVKEGWMETESRNMEWTGVLSVIEQQRYQDRLLTHLDGIPGTHCKTTVTFISKLGETIRKRRKANQSKSASQDVEVEEEAPAKGWFASWSTAGIQRTIELVGVKRTQTAVINSCEGMKVVLERLRNGGVKGVLEAMRRDRMEMIPGHPQPEEGSTPTTWKAVWQQGVSQQDGQSSQNDDRNN